MDLSIKDKVKDDLHECNIDEYSYVTNKHPITSHMQLPVYDDKPPLIRQTIDVIKSKITTKLFEKIRYINSRGSEILLWKRIK
jgi:hypothetical protein